MAYPANRKDAATTEASFLQFVAPNGEVKHIYADNSGELIKACRTLGWRHNINAPCGPQTDCLAERAVQAVIRGTRAVLHNSGLGHAWMGEATQAWCCGRCFTAPCHGAAASDDKHKERAACGIRFGE